MRPHHPSWRIDSELGLGTFSRVFSAIDVVSSRPVAIKYPINDQSAALLENEAKTMSALVKCEYIPKLIDASQSPKFIVMERVGKTLLQLHSERGSMSLKTIFLIALRNLEALESMHDCGFVHRDVKPDNIAISLSPSDSKLYLIDVGLSYRFQRRGVHVGYSEFEEFQGTPFFCSLNPLRGLRCSRRDDLESLGYVLLFLLGRDLPWFCVEYPQRDALQRITRIREKVGIDALCHDLDSVFRDYLNYCRKLKFEEKPNYKYLRNMFITAALRLHIDISDGSYDWSPKPPRKTHRHSLIRSASSVKVRVSSTLKRPSMNMSLLTLDSVEPRHKSKKRRKSQKDVLRVLPDANVPVTEENAGELSTPKCGVEKLPKFRWPRTGLIQQKASEVVT